MLVVFLAAAAQVAAPEQKNSSTQETAEIVVTGERSAEGLSADLVGGSITVIDSVALDRRQTREISDILRDVPGIAVSRIPGQTQVRLRGAEGNHTLVLIDGIEASDPFVGEFDFGTLIADEGTKIEVLRGQQSAVYGSDAIGGVIHYITMTGREAPGVRARLEVGSFGAVNAAARLGGASGDFDYALSGTFLSTDGRPNARNGSRDLGNDSGALSLKSIWTPSRSARLTATFRYTSTKADFNDSDFTSGSPTFGLIVDTPGARFKNMAFYGLVRGEAGLLDGRWTHALSAQLADTQRDVFGAFGRSFGNEGQRLKGSYETTLRLGEGSLRHRVTFALDAERESFRNTDPSGFAFTGRRHVNNIGLVGQYDLEINDTAFLGVSIRRDQNDRFANATTYRVQGSYRPGSATKLRAAASSGVKNPTFYELFGFVDGRFIGNPGLKPERSEGWEAGIEQEFTRGQLVVGATYFDSVLRDEIFTDRPPPTFVATPGNRTTTSTQRGLEAFARARMGDGWQIDAAYTYLHARENGVREVRRATHIASLAVDWRIPRVDGGVTLVGRYNGAQDDDAFLDPAFIPVRVRLGGYFLLNLNADFRLVKNLSLFARAENLLDEDYEEVFSFVTPGRSGYIGLRLRF